MDGSLSASDVALMSGRGYGDGWGGDGYGGMFGLLVLLGMMNGGFGGWGNNRDFATTQDVNNAQQFGQILDGNRDIMTQANNNTNALLSAVNSAEYENIAVVKDAQLQLQDRLADLHSAQQAALANQNQCCCNIRMEVANQSAGINQNLMQNRYEGALNTASINDTTNAVGQKILDALAQDRIERLQARVNQLELDKATAGMLRFPSTWTYGAGPFPPLPVPQTVGI